MRRRTKGFTLIELIVVIAVIGVLAAILVPAMLGYIKKSKQTQANENARVIYEQLMLSAVELDAQGITMGVNGSFVLSDVGVAGDSGDCVEMDVWLSGPGFSQAQQEVFRKGAGGYIDIVYQSGYPVAVAWSKSKEADAVIGRYPEAIALDDGVTWKNWDDNL
ncbi:MAG: type II secretion system protein [Oscillospiraceae bacterium]